MTATAGVLGESDYESWDRFVCAQDRTGSIFSTARYLDLLCHAAGGSFSVIAVRDGQGFLGGIGLYRQQVRGRSAITPRMLLSYNGLVLRDDLLALDGAAGHRLGCMDALRAALSEQNVDRIRLRCREGYQDFRPFIGNGWHAAPIYTIVVPVADPKGLWTRFDRNARRMVRRAEHAGCTVRADNDIDTLFAAHQAVHERKGSPLYLHEGAFRRFVAALIHAQLGVVYTSRLASGEPAAAQLVLLGNHPCSHTVCAGSFPNPLATGAGYLLRWRTFADLGERGYALNDLTDASPGPVTRFKEQLGGMLKMDMALHWRRPPLERLMVRGARWLQALRPRRAIQPPPSIRSPR